MSAPESLALELEQLVRKLQADKRLPSIAAAVVRDGEIVWETAVGLAGVDAGLEATPDTQYRIGSITKTFTAVAVMQLRDEGKLDLEDPLDRHLEGAAPAPALRRLLSHTSGIQREPPGDVWETLRFAPAEELLGVLEEAEQVLPPGARWHYSNLAFSLLGLMVARISGLPYERYLKERILGPLGLERTSLRPQEPAAVGYLVQPYADDVWEEAPVETGGWIPAGQMWGTVRDLCRWAAFLVDPDPAVLEPESAEEMRVAQSLSDHERWTGGHGLGLSLRRDRERILIGHGGSMPGFIAGLYVSPADKIGAAVLTNSTSTNVEELTLKLIERTVEEMPAPPEEWRVQDPPPGELESVLGLWFMEGTPLVFRWKKGRLEAGFPDAPDWVQPSAFRREDENLYRTISGPEQGERLRLVRDDEGRVERMYWATYPVTRQPGVWGRQNSDC
ncbi:MAG TPA: serine hydrolase domain-containing protein [Gaiellaceae bacterium]